MSTLRCYVRHAQLYGVAGIYEAATNLDAEQRATLADRLRELDPKWRPPRNHVQKIEQAADMGSTSPETRGLSVTNSARQEDRSPPTLSVTRCGSCGRQLHPERSTRRYCSRACQQVAHRQRTLAT